LYCTFLFFRWFIGGKDGILVTLAAFVMLDMVSFVIVAVSERSISGSLFAKEFVKKAYILLIVGVSNIIDAYLISDGNNIRIAIMLYFIGSEGITVLEGAARIGLPVPEKLKNILGQLQKK
jgi:toxin secretion/phage lysis holin